MQNRESFPRRVTILVVPKTVHITAFLVGWLYSSIYIWALNNRLEMHVPSYVWIFSPNKSDDVELWLWRINSEVFNCRENLENSTVATGLEKFSFHCNPKERRCQRMLKLPHNFTHLTYSCYQSNAQNSPREGSTIHELWTSRCSTLI